MKTGRPRKPTALKLLEGETRPSRVPQNEPKPRPSRPLRPTFLNAGAKRVWNALVDELERTGVLTTVDQSALAGFCSAYEEAKRLSRFIDRHGYTVETPAGYIQQRPEVSIRNKAWDRVDKFGAQLGIGAAHRSRIEVKKQDAEETPFAAIVAEEKAEREARRRKG